MEPNRSRRAHRPVSGLALLAITGIAAAVLGCDPQAGPDSAGGTNQQGSGDIFDTGGGGGPQRDCGGGPYLFSVSASDVDPFQQSGEVGAQGVTTLWLWKASGGGLGAVAGDFEVESPGDPATFVDFEAVAPNLNIDQEGIQQVFMAVYGCPYGPTLLGKLTVYGVPDTLRIRLAALQSGSLAVDCCSNKPGVPLECDWFESVPPDTAGSDSTQARSGSGRAD